jgi:hypothetical protein
LPRLGPFRVRVLLVCVASYDPYFVICIVWFPCGGWFRLPLPVSGGDGELIPPFGF